MQKYFRIHSGVQVGSFNEKNRGKKSCVIVSLRNAGSLKLTKRVKDFSGPASHVLIHSTIPFPNRSNPVVRQFLSANLFLNRTFYTHTEFTKQIRPWAFVRKYPI
jgi:hypothetical protein